MNGFHDTVEGFDLTHIQDLQAEADTIYTVAYPYTVVPNLYSFGTDTRAAYGGSVDPVILHVDTLVSGISNTDSTHGSFEWALSQTYPRVVVFDVSGVIEGKATFLEIRDPYISILGQTSPNHIVYKGAGLQVLTHDVLIQHMIIRNGNYIDYDCINISSAIEDVYGVVIDHVSMSWAGDESAGFAESGGNSLTNSSFNNCIISNPIEATNSYNSLNYAQDIAHIGNLYAHGKSRNPQLGYTCKMAVYNTVVYNWHQYSALLGGDGTEELTYVGNVQIPGTNSSTGYEPSMHVVAVGSAQIGQTSIIFMDDNIKWDGSLPSYDVGLESGATYSVGTQITIPNYVPLSSSQTKESVLANVGAWSGNRDAFDTTLIADVVAGTGGYTETYPTEFPTYTETTQSFVPVANPHDMYNTYYTNLENQIHQLSAVVEGK